MRINNHYYERHLERKGYFNIKHYHESKKQGFSSYTLIKLDIITREELTPQDY